MVDDLCRQQGRRTTHDARFAQRKLQTVNRYLVPMFHSRRPRVSCILILLLLLNLQHQASGVELGNLELATSNWPLGLVI